METHFAKCVLRFMGPKATSACHDGHICAGVKAGTEDAVHGVQYIWDDNLSTENWVFLLVDVGNTFHEINRIGMLCTVCDLWSSGSHFFKLLSSLFIAHLVGMEWYDQFSS